MIPNKFTFSQLLNKCASLQAHEEGRHIHTQIILRGYESDVFVGYYNIFATLERYACMVDLLGLARHLQDTENIINIMTCKPNVAGWMTSLGAYRVHGNVKMEEQTAKQVVKLAPGSSWGLQRSLKKEYSCTWISVHDNKVCAFMEELQRQMKDIEYKFDTKFMLWKRRTKDASLFPAHSKNLDIAFWPIQHLLVF
ncbi:hypothetical protein CY35_08G132000 [Sphagnum magellanicum]|nr:hypothetical protein CY35_08G132000 [Sphagnum magellanicum]